MFCYTASADWTVRVWDSKYTSQIICFDLSMMVVDAVWAPYSSTGKSNACLHNYYTFHN